MYNAALPEMTPLAEHVALQAPLARPAPLGAQPGLAQALRPVRRQGGMRGTGHRVFVDADVGPEPARDEIEALAARGHRHPAARQALQPGKSGARAAIVFRRRPPRGNRRSSRTSAPAIPSASSSPSGVAQGSGRLAGKSIASESPPRRTLSSPLRVAKRSTGEASSSLGSVPRPSPGS